jgi:hypothetical protein
MFGVVTMFKCYSMERDFQLDWGRRQRKWRLEMAETTEVKEWPDLIRELGSDDPCLSCAVRKCGLCWVAMRTRHLQEDSEAYLEALFDDARRGIL